VRAIRAAHLVTLAIRVPPRCVVPRFFIATDIAQELFDFFVEIGTGEKFRALGKKPFDFVSHFVGP
jgi:hypothetical protein